MDYEREYQRGTHRQPVERGVSPGLRPDRLIPPREPVDRRDHGACYLDDVDDRHGTRRRRTDGHGRDDRGRTQLRCDRVISHVVERHGDPDLMAGHPPVVVGLDTNLVSWWIPAQRRQGSASLAARLPHPLRCHRIVRSERRLLESIDRYDSFCGIIRDISILGFEHIVKRASPYGNTLRIRDPCLSC